MSSDETGSPKAPQTPASTLLFQAPEFTAPEFVEPSTPAKKTGNESAARRPQKGDPQNRKSKGSEADSADEGEGRPTKTDPDRQNPPKKGKSKGNKSTKSAKHAQADSGAEEPSTGNDGGEGGARAAADPDSPSTRRRRRRARSDGADSDSSDDQVQSIKGSTRLEAKRMRRREGRRDGRRRHSITESEFLARRESVDRRMIVRHEDGSDQIAVLEDGILVEHFVARRTNQSIVGNIYLGKVQNVLPSMEAAFVDIGKGRNAVLYAGEVNWDALGMQGKPRRIETALAPGDNVLVQVAKDPIGHKGARLTSQITLAGRYLVLVPGSSVLGISRKLPENERARLKKVLKQLVPDGTGVIVRTAAEGATEEQLSDDVKRLAGQWEKIEKKVATTRKAPVLLRGEQEMVVRVVRDLFNEDVASVIVQGDETYQTVHEYVEELSPELLDRLEKWNSKEDVFDAKNIRSQLAKGMDRKVWLPSGGTLIIERTEALTVVDVNTGKFVGSGGTLEETVTRNNLEAAEEIVRQLRLRDIGGIIIIDFVDMVLEANRELVLRRLVEALGRDRTRHQVTEITSLGLVQMTRKRVGEGLVEAFSTTCEVCEGRGFIVHDHPVEHGQTPPRGRRKQGGHQAQPRQTEGRGRERQKDDRPTTDSHVGDEKVKSALSAIAAATVPSEDAHRSPSDQNADAKTGDGEGGGRGKPDGHATSSAHASASGPTAGGDAKAEGAPRAPRQRRAVRTRGVDTRAAAQKREQSASASEDAKPKSEEAPEQRRGAPEKVERKPAASLDDIVLPTEHVPSKAVTRPQRRRAVVTGPLDTRKAAPKATQAKAANPEEAQAKEESAREAVRDLFGSQEG